jgi:hypothetical protein
MISFLAFVGPIFCAELEYVWEASWSRTIAGGIVAIDFSSQVSSTGYNGRGTTFNRKKEQEQEKWKE